jgi:cyclic pyranopterin phosphate synthase
MKLQDKYNRVHDYLRISITDKCNLNCIYCNPKNNSHNHSRQDELLSFEEIYRIAFIFLDKFEFTKIRLTGGEPFARRDIDILIQMLGSLKNEFSFELSATTNGTLLNGNIQSYINLGLDRLNFSLDSLRNETFENITGYNQADKTIKAIQRAKDNGIKNIKINTVIMKGINELEILDFVDFVKNEDMTVRFIEYMPFSNNQYNTDYFFSMSEIIEVIKSRYNLIEILDKNTSVSKEFRIDGYKGKVSVISSISDHFCNNCNRLRINSSGKLRLCLFSPNNDTLDLKKMINKGNSDIEVAEAIISAINFKQESHASIKELMALENNNMISIGG